MNIASIVVLVAVLALAALAALHCMKNGAPCECDGKCGKKRGCHRV